MRVYSATQTLFNGTDPVPYNAIPSGRYFRSHADARKWGNSLIRSFLEMQRQWDKGFRLDAIGWAAVIEIEACDFAKTGKDTLLTLLNNDGGPFSKVQRVEKWTPQTKWTKVEVGDGDTLRS